MTVSEAEDIVREHYDKPFLNDEEFFEVTEALKFIIDEENDPYCMIQLSGFYMANKDYELAYKYSEMARQLDYPFAYSCVADIYFDGLLGEPDYKKAFDYYSYDYEKEDRIMAGLHIAYMYRDGLYVQKDYEKYKKLIKELYPKVNKSAEEYPEYQDAEIPEVYYELASIFIAENHKESAAALLKKAKIYLAKRLEYNYYADYIVLMHSIVDKLYELISPDDNSLDIYDLFYILGKPSKADLVYNNTSYTVISAAEDSMLSIKFNNKWYRDINEFFEKASIDGVNIINLYEKVNVLSQY